MRVEYAHMLCVHVGVRVRVRESVSLLQRGWVFY